MSDTSLITSPPVTVELSGLSLVNIAPPPISGGGGNANGTYEVSFATASAVWVIRHNLDRYPSVTTVDSAGSEIKGDLKYLDSNTLQITFSAATGGFAYLN